MSRAPGLRTPSLRRRVTLIVVALIAVMLVVLVVAADLVLQNRLDSQLRDRLVDRAGIASALVDRVDGRDLARRLEGDGVSVLLRTADGEVYAEGPLAGAASAELGADTATPAPEGPDTGAGPAGPPGPGPGGLPDAPAGSPAVAQDGDRLSLTRDLSDGSSVVLLADAADIARTIAQVRVTLVVTALLVLLVAAGVVPLVVRRALRPLEQITDVARSITRGDREQRLNPLQPSSELGRTAVAFDDMLDAVVGAEQRALGSQERLRDFLSDAAHELRTPLTGVQAAAEHLLREDPDRLEREQVVLGLIRETRRAGRLVDDMLLMGRIDGGLVLTRTEVDLRVLAQEAIEQRSLAHPALDLGVEGDAVEVVVDRDRIAQVLANLVDNAVHALAGRVSGRVTLSVSVAVSSTGREARVDVLDDGPGVPPGERERIFERLVRLDDSRSARSGGAGLGLPIARGIARAHGGDLRCLEPGNRLRGACFRLTLPAAGP